VLPLTRLQAEVAVASLGAPATPISVTLDCSGTEVIAMCLGAVLAYPVRWRSRWVGALGIAIGILALNTLRIGTLGIAAARPSVFDALHLYIWPALLTLGSAGAVFWWIRRVDRTTTATMSPSWQFAALALGLIALSAVTAPVYIESGWVRRIGEVIAATAGVLLSVAGAQAHAAGNVLWTARGGFSVTGECVATPMLPLYLAAVWIYAPTRAYMVLGTLAAVPIFLILGVVRLLLVALPQSLTPSPEFWAHAFYQIVLGTIVVVMAGRWSHGASRASGSIAAGLASGLAFVVVAGTLYTRLVLGSAFLDPQGAVAFLPAFQVGLYLAIWIATGRTVRWPMPTLGLIVLVASHLAGAWWLALPAVPVLLAAHVGSVRAWAIAGPLLMFGAVVAHDRARR
jgi:exosortase/archaeosortase family protein